MCQRKIVAGFTISRNPAKRPAGSVPAGNAGHAWSGPRQPRMSPRPLTQSHRKLMAQYQGLGVLPPRLPPRQAQHRHGPGHDEEDQLQAHKPKIIARQPEPRPARQAPFGLTPAASVPQSICRAAQVPAPTGRSYLCRGGRPGAGVTWKAGKSRARPAHSCVFAGHRAATATGEPVNLVCHGLATCGKPGRQGNTRRVQVDLRGFGVLMAGIGSRALFTNGPISHHLAQRR
jgi:hypothetical protein